MVGSNEDGRGEMSRRGEGRSRGEAIKHSIKSLIFPKNSKMMCLLRSLAPMSYPSAYPVSQERGPRDVGKGFNLYLLKFFERYIRLLIR